MQKCFIAEILFMENLDPWSHLTCDEPGVIRERDSSPPSKVCRAPYVHRRSNEVEKIWFRIL
jgi:hypothetical protein